MIVETEAYSWKEKGCHAYGSRKTQRNAVMFEKGGYSYVYLCYGMHNLFNIVTTTGTSPMPCLSERRTNARYRRNVIRRGKLKNDFHLTSGPGKLTKALGIDRKLNGKFLAGDEVWVEDSGHKFSNQKIEPGPRIGIDYAGEDALLPWRFTLKGNDGLSK